MNVEIDKNNFRYECEFIERMQCHQQHFFRSLNPSFPHHNFLSLLSLWKLSFVSIFYVVWNFNSNTTIFSPKFYWLFSSYFSSSFFKWHKGSNKKALKRYCVNFISFLLNRHLTEMKIEHLFLFIDAHKELNFGIIHSLSLYWL